jgi:peptidoglycan/xylan/chitin deacetylase (PgdA/CDA1 family)
MTNTNIIRVAQCWDDGVTDDIRLIDLLRKHGAKASFNLNAGLHKDDATGGWRYKGIKDVMRLPRRDLLSVYDGFLVANHTATHPHLTQISPEKAESEIREGKDALEQLFGYPVTGFAYPFGDYNPAIEEAVRAAGHVYARTVVNVADVFPPENPMAFHANCHFQAKDFWERFNHVSESGGVFYLWGHSYELVTEDDWTAFDRQISLLSANPRVQWVDLPSLFAAE